MISQERRRAENRVHGSSAPGKFHRHHGRLYVLLSVYGIPPSSQLQVQTLC
ncbi:hypothetical protein JMJ77_0004094, partial [Colletotrichum scovillei]